MANSSAGCSITSMDVTGSALLSLPVELLENIALCLTYDEIARLRLVCMAFDRLGQGLLNKGFLTVEKYHGKCHRSVKALLPRRESERRSHPMARHCDIFNAVETRLSLLNMTFIKYMDMKLCCFIPGKVIDEIYRILRELKEKTPPRAHEILQELRDISSMAMEHFDEKIVPILKQKMMLSTHIGQSSTTVALPSLMGIAVSGEREGQFSKWIQPGLLKLHHNNKKTCAMLTAIKKQHDVSKLKISEAEKKVQDQGKKILELNHVITDQETKIVDQQEQINELSKKFMDYEKKFGEMFAITTVGKKSVAEHGTTSIRGKKAVNDAPVAVRTGPTKVAEAISAPATVHVEPTAGTGASTRSRRASTAKASAESVGTKRKAAPTKKEIASKKTRLV